MNSTRLKKLFEFLQDDPSDPFTLYAIGLEYTKSDLTTAMEYFERLMQEHREYTGTYYQAGKVAEKLGQPEKAVDIYEKGIIICRENRDLHALSELQSALNMLRDEDSEDDDY